MLYVLIFSLISNPIPNLIISYNDISQASIEMPGIKALFSLRSSENGIFDKFLVQSYIGETRVLSIEGEEMGEVSTF